MWISAFLVALFLAQPAVDGRKALDLLLAGNFPEFGKLLTPLAKQKLTLEFLRDHIGPEMAGFGKPGEIDPPTVAANQVSFPVHFSRVTVNVQFTLDPSGRVAALVFRPAAAYSDPKLFTDREVSIGSDEWTLPGTLSVPNSKGPFRGVVLVHGPGPDDRDETLFSNRMFKDVAEGLASRGFEVLRYDKRTKVYGERMSGTSYTLQQETVEDAVRATAFLRGQPNVRKVFIVAHSLGGYALPRIARQDGKLAGAVVLAGNSRPIEDVLLDQATYTTQHKVNPVPEDQTRLEGLKSEIAKVKALDANRKDNPPVVLGLPLAYFLDLKSYNPVAETKGLSLPILFLHGERDFLVPIKDFQLWKSGLQGRPATQFHSYPALNHLFMTVDYRIPGNVEPEVINDIATWLAAQ